MADCFRLAKLSLHCPVDDIPISRDERITMREAQYHYAAAANQMPGPSTAPSQLDPGSLYDASRRTAGGRQGGASGTGTGRTGAGGGANSLLKQAIANRLKPSPTSENPVPATSSLDIPEGRTDEMNKSIIMNPAWYRDQDGRTGFKPKEWENMPNQQKDQVKRQRTVEDEKEGGEGVRDLEAERLRREEREKRREKRRQAKAELEEALEELEEVTSESAEPTEKKLTKEEKKAQKEKEKEEKKREKEREKEEKEREKEEKKKEKEREKEENKREKDEKKRKSVISLEASGKEDDGSKTDETENAAAKGYKKEKRRSSKERKAPSEDAKDTALKSTKDGRDSDSSDLAKIEERREKRRSSKERKERESRAESREKKTLTSMDSRDSDSSDLAKMDEKREKRRSSKERKSSTGSTDPSQMKTSEEKRKLVRTDALSERRDSNVSCASSNRSDATVREVVSPTLSRKPPSGRPQMNFSSPQSSSTEEERNRTGRTVAAGVKPAKETIGSRRDSSMSESSRMSGKSVTFSDRIQLHEIERRPEYSSEEEDDAAIMSDDELSRPDSERRRRMLRMLQNQEEDEEDDQRDLIRPGTLDFEYDDDDDFEEQERRAMMLEGIPPEYPVYDLENASQSSYYPEDANPDRFLVDEEGSYISLDHLPTSVRRAIAAEMSGRSDEGGVGTMSRLHDDNTSRQSSLLGYPPLPRSASGYLEENYMLNSYQRAMYGGDAGGHEAFHHSGPETSPQAMDPTFEQQRKLQESFYDNVHGKAPSRTASLTGSSLIPKLDTRRSSTQDDVTPVPSPPRKGSSTSIDRAAFFESSTMPSLTGGRGPSVTPTPSPPRMISMNEPQQRILVTTTTTSSNTLKRTEILEKEERAPHTSEDDMKRRFVARFGARKAPIAEEDPTDPIQSARGLGSQESVMSTDSRESVVSAASIKTESTVRRNFNY